MIPTLSAATIALVYIFILSIESLSNNHIQVKTDLGWIKGNILETTTTSVDQLQDNPSKIYEFLGIRYGVPPVGNLRFRPSSVYSYPFSSSFSSTPNSQLIDATSYGPACYQLYGSRYNITNMSEDCLFLNIWTPYNMNMLNSNISSKNSSSSPKYKVMIWIHGGGFTSGAGSMNLYSSDIITSRGENIVAVTINYRLGALGFFASEELYKENIKYNNYSSYGGMTGIHDQIIAIQWVKQYISSFGGDPDDITIYGESAGGVSSCVLFFSPLMRSNMIKQVIIQSGACNGPWGPAETITGLYYTNKRCENANLPNNLTYLRELEPMSLLRKV